MTALEQATGAQGVESANLKTQVKALIWEECRTGGAIAALCTGLGLIFVLEAWLGYESAAWQKDAPLVMFAILGMPIATGLLLILNPNTSGHLVGGFSSRILRLPVTTTTAVAVALASRTILVFLSSLILVSSSTLHFVESPGLNVVLWITLFYLVAQLLDWLRAPVSGLTSIILICFAGIPMLFLLNNSFRAMILRMMRGSTRIPEEIEPLTSSPQVSLSLALFVALAAAAVYFVSLGSVHADRVGRRYGFPEIWEWPRSVSFSSSGARKPFSSPLAAQVWFELRRTKGWLPIGSVALLVLFAGIALAIASGERSPGYIQDGASVFAFLLFPPMLLAAAAQGARTRVLGFRSATGTAGFEYLQPLTTAQCAQARVVANALILLPTLVVFLILHFALGGRAFVSETILESLRLGIATWREVAWILVSRGLLFGVFAWAFLAIGTRTFRRGIVFLFVLVLVNLAVAENIRFTNIALGFLISGVTMGLFVYAERQSLIPRRSLLAWLGVWVLFGWLFHYAFTTVWFQMQPSAGERLVGVATALGSGALVPLAYIGWVLDIQRRRHGAARKQDPEQYGQAIPFAQLGSGRVAISAVVVLAVLWLGWPASPGYVQFRRDQGLPVTLAELNDWYVEPESEENVALDYVAIAQNHNRLATAFEIELRRTSLSDFKSRFLEKMLVVGGAELVRNEPIDRDVWNETMTRWEAFTPQVVQPLRDLTKQEGTLSRYPIDLNYGYTVDLPHLAGVRSLARELRLDALVASVESNAVRAKENIVAQFAIANSLNEEPILISQLVRIAIASLTVGTIEYSMNRLEFDERELGELQEACEAALSADDGMRRAHGGESLFLMSALDSFASTWGSNMEENQSSVTLFLHQLLFPASAECMTYLSYLEELTKSGEQSRIEYESWRDAFRDRIYSDSAFMSPVTGIMASGLSGTYETVWRNRMQLETARAALAVDRYRLANGRLPDALDALVPDFLSEVTTDYFDANQSLLRYAARDDGEFVVYSVGRDMEDDLGVEMEDARLEGDITFTVAPLSVRNGPHVKAE